MVVDNFNDDENTDRNDSHDDDDDDDDDFIRRPEKNSHSIGYNCTLPCFHQ